MTNFQAALIGAALIASAALIGHIVPQASAQTRGGGPYVLMHHSNTNALAGVFRLDTSSGEVSYCYIGNDQSLTCSRSVQ